MSPIFTLQHSKYHWQSIIGSALSVGLISGCLLTYVLRHKISIILWRRKIKMLIKVPRTIKIVNRIEKWDKIFPQLEREVQSINAVGFDTEWVQRNSCRHPVALLQLATHTGFCVLVRLSHMKHVPHSLKLMLEDRNIVKVGVGIDIDKDNLLKDYNIAMRGCLDLRHLELGLRDALKIQEKQESGYGLKALAAKYLGKNLNKIWWIRHSDWETDNLTKSQINYAAEDALVGIQILLQFLSKLWDPPSNLFTAFYMSYGSCIKTAVKEVCGSFLDEKYRYKTSVAVAQQKKVAITNPLKESRRSYSTRQTPLYHNSQLWAPDDEPLCTCDPQKALWYVEKGLGELVSEDPLIVKLNFEPAGRPFKEGTDGQFYLQERLNVCVVCGKNDSYIRKNIVPHEYRKHFPKILKAHQSHDVLLLCVDCHQLSNIRDSTLKYKLANECDAPIGCETDCKVSFDGNLKAIRSAGGALLRSRAQLPVSRIDALEAILKSYFNTDTLSVEQITAAANLDTLILNENYVPHGYKVYLAYKKCGLILLEQRWREWFLESMQPEYLPENWSVTHNHNKLKIKMSRYPVDHPYREDYKVALFGTEDTEVNVDIPYKPNKNRDVPFAENFFGLDSSVSSSREVSPES